MRFAVLSLFAACATVGPTTSTMPQPLVADAAWLCVGGQGPTPIVAIVPQSQLTCSNHTTQALGFGCGTVDHPMHPSLPCVCLAGDEHGTPIRVARTGPPVTAGIQRWHSTALVHELYHRAILQATGDDDPNHYGTGWSTIVPACNRKLEEGGM